MTVSDLLPGCFPLRPAGGGGPAAREAVVETGHWRVAHAFDSSLAGWLVLLPTRHVTSFAELEPGRGRGLGGLVRRLSLALESVTGCVKTYLMQFSEAEGSRTCTSTWCRGWRTSPRAPGSAGLRLPRRRRGHPDPGAGARRAALTIRAALDV